MILETERLRVILLTIEQFELLLSGTDKIEKELGLILSGETLDEHTQQAMEYNYKEALKYPDSYLWYTNWQIILKAENKSIGSACFKNKPNERDEVEIGYGTNTDYRNQGYMTEAAATMCKWAICQTEIKSVIAETEKSNIASQRVLQKVGMTKYKISNTSFWWRLNPAVKDGIKVISVRENPEYKDIAIDYISSKWASVSRIIYDDSVNHCILSPNSLPQWYLLEKDKKIIGCAGLITNDFISRMDLYPWICALYIEEEYRGSFYSSLLMDKAIEDTINAGYKSIYLCTDHVGFYEKYGFNYIGQGYHPWDEESRIYELSLVHKPEFRIRIENQNDYAEIYSLIKIAFETAKVKDGDEQDFAENLRKGEGYIPELALVAEAEGKLIGHIMLTKTYVQQPDGSKFEGLLIAPVSVLLEYRSYGVGGDLIKRGLDLAKEMGYKAVFLCGDPAYYHRFGFRSTASFGIKYIHDIPDKYIMAYELQSGSLDNVIGTIDCQ